MSVLCKKDTQLITERKVQGKGTCLMRHSLSFFGMKPVTINQYGMMRSISKKNSGSRHLFAYALDFCGVLMILTVLAMVGVLMGIVYYRCALLS